MSSISVARVIQVKLCNTDIRELFSCVKSDRH